MVKNKAGEWNIGMEVEVATNGEAMAEFLFDVGEAPSAGLCAYHCNCVDHFRPSMDFHPQRDGTVDGEMVSRVLKYGTDEFYKATELIQTAALAVGAERGRYAGSHVHVGHENMDEDAKQRLVSLFMRYQPDLRTIAAGAASSIRDSPYCSRVDLSDTDPWHLIFNADEAASLGRFQSAPRYDQYGYRYASGDWRYAGEFFFHGAGLNYTGSTWEFRIWNSTITSWRWEMNVGISVAMCRAAVAGEVGHVHHTFLETVGPYMDDNTVSHLFTQIAYKGGLPDAA